MMPMALEPPPTQAQMASGWSMPYSLRSCSLASSPMIFWKSRTMVGNGCGPATVPSR